MRNLLWKIVLCNIRKIDQCFQPVIRNIPDHLNCGSDHPQTDSFCGIHRTFPLDHIFSLCQTLPQIIYTKYLSVLSSHFSLRNRLTDPFNIRIQWFIYIFQLQWSNPAVCHNTASIRNIYCNWGKRIFCMTYDLIQLFQIFIIDIPDIHHGNLVIRFIFCTSDDFHTYPAVLLFYQSSVVQVNAFSAFRKFSSQIIYTAEFQIFFLILFINILIISHHFKAFRKTWKHGNSTVFSSYNCISICREINLEYPVKNRW